jgi:hypothetical protein
MNTLPTKEELTAERLKALETAMTSLLEAITITVSNVRTMAELCADQKTRIDILSAQLTALNTSFCAMRKD